MTISITSDEKENIHFPREFGIKPREKFYVDKVDDSIVIKKANEEMINTKEIGNRIAEILKKNLKGVKWKEIEKGREDKEREW
mgnify:CR=1 FL=1